MKILIIDNYDSFTYNLYACVRAVAPESKVLVRENDQISTEEVAILGFDRIIISPGPGNPEDQTFFGVCRAVLERLAGVIPILGVCLGMQGLASVFGAQIIRAGRPMHGKISPINHDGKGIFRGLPQPLSVMRYHSLIVAPESLPKDLIITSWNRKGEIMGLRHSKWALEGVQFHPESFATQEGEGMILNFLS